MFESFNRISKQEGAGQEGKRYENNLLGEVDIQDPDYKGDLDRVKKPAERGSVFPYYVKFKDALELVRNYQPKTKEGRVELNNSQKDFLNDLRLEIVEQLGLDEDKAEKLRVYTANGSPLDVLHGTDFVIDYDGNILRGDITLFEKGKGKERKAEIQVFGEFPNPKLEEDRYLERIEDVANQVAVRILKEKYYGRYPMKKK